MQAAKDTDIPISFLRECFDLDAKTGVLTRRARPREHFPSARAWAVWNARWADKAVGVLRDDGYSRMGLEIDGREFKIYVHRAVFALVHGRWPIRAIDHR